MLGLGSRAGQSQAKKRLGEMLVEAGHLTPEDLKRVLALQQKKGGLLGRILVHESLIDEDVLLAFLKKQHETVTVSLADYSITKQAVDLLPQELCEKGLLLPIDKLGRILIVAMVDPLDSEMLEQVQQHCKDFRIKPVHCRWEDFAAVFKRIYNKDLVKPEELEERYAALDVERLTAAVNPNAQSNKRKKSQDTSAVPTTNGTPIAMLTSDDVDVAAPESLADLKAPEFDLISPREFVPATSISASEITSGIRDLAASVSLSIQDAMRDLVEVMIAQHTNQTSTAETEQLATAIQQTLEGSISALADEIRQDREELKSVLLTLQKDVNGAPPWSDKLENHLEMFLHQVTDAIAEQIGQVGVAVRELGDSLPKEEPSPAIQKILEETIKHVSRESADRLSDSLRGLFGQQPKPPDPTQIAVLIRDGISGVIENALAALTEQIHQMSKTQEDGLAAMPRATDFHEAIRTLHEHLSKSLDSRLEMLSDHLKLLLEKEHEEDSKRFESLAGAVCQGIITAVAASEKNQSEQQQILIEHLQRTLEKYSALGEKSIETFAASVQQGITTAIRSTEQNQQVLLQSVTEKIESALSAFISNKTPHEETLSNLANAILAIIRENKEAQDQRQAELTQIAHAAFESVRQTAELLEAQQVAEAAQNDLLRRRQAQHASVSPLHGDTITIDHELFAAEDARVREKLESQQPAAELTFDNFFVGEANTFTVNLAKSVSQAPGGQYNPLFLYGPVGVGKTHLVSAIGNEVLARPPAQKDQPPARVGYTSASTFARRLAAAIADNALELFRDNYCHWDVLILDDIQFLGGRVEAQEEFFHIFNALLQAGRQMIIVADKAPDKLGLLEQRLVSRFAGGIVAELKAPDWETRLQILRHTAQAAKIKIPEEILSFIALRVPDDTRKMIGALRKIIAFAQLQGNKITMDQAQTILGHLPGN